VRAGDAVAVVVVILAVLVAALPDLRGGGLVTNLLFMLVYFLLTLMHTVVRVGRKTYVIDMAEGDQRTAYVAVSNTAVGLVLLLVGVVSSALATVHIY